MSATLPTLYLTATELAVFNKLPSEVKSAVEAEKETTTFQDSESLCAARMKNLVVRNPALKEIQKRAKTEKMTLNQVIEMAKTTELKGLDNEDLMALSFAWGPTVFDSVIASALPHAITAGDAKALADLSFIRHGLLLAFNQ